MVITCQHCGQRLNVPHDKGRLRVTCPACKEIFFFEPESHTEVNAIPSPWVLAGWDRPEQCYAMAFAQSASGDWEYYKPMLCWVDCAGGQRKPAIFIKVGLDYAQWTETVELRAFQWQWFPTENYVLLCLSMYFEDTKGGIIGLATPGSTYIITPDFIKIRHKLVCRTFFNPADPQTQAIIKTWAKMQGLVIFLVENIMKNINYITYPVGPDGKSPAVDQLDEAIVKLREMGSQRGSFVEACKAVADQLPCIGRWEQIPIPRDSNSLFSFQNQR